MTKEVKLIGGLLFVSFILGGVVSALMARWAAQIGDPVLPFAITNTALAAVSFYVARIGKGMLLGLLAGVHIMAAFAAWVYWAMAMWLPKGIEAPVDDSPFFSAGHLILGMSLATGVIILYATYQEDKERSGADGSTS